MSDFRLFNFYNDKARILQFLDNYEEDVNGKTSPKDLQTEITNALGIIFYHYDYLSFGKIIKAKFPCIKLVNRKGTYCYPIRKRFDLTNGNNQVTNQANHLIDNQQYNDQPSSSGMNNAFVDIRNNQPSDDNEPINIQIEKLKEIDQRISELLQNPTADLKAGFSNILMFDYQRDKGKILEFVSSNYTVGGKTSSKDLRNDITRHLGIVFEGNNFNMLGRILETKWPHIQLRKQSSGTEEDENGQRKPIYYYCIRKKSSLPNRPHQQLNRSKLPNFRTSCFPQTNGLYRVVKQKDNQDQSRFVVQPVAPNKQLNQSNNSSQAFDLIGNMQNQTQNSPPNQSLSQLLNNQVLLNCVSEQIENFKNQMKEEIRNQVNIQLFSFKNQIKQELSEELNSQIKEVSTQTISLHLDQLINNFKGQINLNEQDASVDDDRVQEEGEIDLSDDQTYGTEFNISSWIPSNN